MLGLFLEAQGHPLPEHSKTKSASALSRFLNINLWSTRDVIRTVRNHALEQVLSEHSLGRKPFLQIIIDLTTLEKCGKFKEFENLISVYNGKRGLHLVVIPQRCWKVAYSLEFPHLERQRNFLPCPIRSKTS
ncbi:MAG: hypothetical protein PUP92_33365 [Rhizonema sp. PD38]|nr:hypothetical protein [Rhizonema sp. PD38]